MSADPASAESEDFSLVVGGPLYQLFLRIGLVRPPLDRVEWRMFLIPMIAWMPLLILTVLDGRFFGGVRIPFLRDFEVHVRLLVSLPLLIFAEVIVHSRMKPILSQFLQRRIVTSSLEARFREIMESAIRLRNSRPVELGLMLFILLLGGILWRKASAAQTDTWYAMITSDGIVTTPAGFYYQIVSVRVFQFILIRWYFRLFIWTRFLWQVSRLNLNLIPTHPDRACGLGFLEGIVPAIAPLLMAHTCVLSGTLANRILYQGSKLTDFYSEIAMMAGFLYLLAVGPLCLFTTSLIRSKRLGLQVYGKLASDYVIEFNRKWIRGERPADEPLVGTGDIQSLADLGNSFSVVQSIIPFPFGRNALVGLTVMVALPLLPLVLTMFSLQELLLRLVGLVL